MERVKALIRTGTSVDAPAGKGKADAVFTAYDVARGDVLMILVPISPCPEQLPSSQAIKLGKGEFINGSRLVYPLEKTRCVFSTLSRIRLFRICSRGC